MSAICGIFHLDGRPASREDVAPMSAALAHRGPHGGGSWSSDAVALAHRALHTTLESVAEVQPAIRGQGRLVLVADARIDNREELGALLRIPSVVTTADSDFILAAYERWGSSCAERLRGDFAFALWDSRARVLFCARDPMGVKPFYYVHSDRRFAFATEVKALLTILDAEPEPDIEEIALYVGARQEDRVRTMYKGIHRLPAAHSLAIEQGRRALTRHWHAGALPDVRFRKDDEYVDRFRELFSDAIAARLRSAYPVGAALSGGLDSSSIVCVARSLRPAGAPPLHTYSLVFPSLPERDLRLIDERAFVDAVVGGGGVQPHFVRGDELGPLEDMERVLWYLDEPYCAPNLYLHWGMFRAAAEQGVRVFLDGLDGDTAVSHGFGRLTDLARAKHWDLLEAEARAFGVNHGKPPELAIRQYALPHLSELAHDGRWLAWGRAAKELSHRFALSRRELLVANGLRSLVPPAVLRLVRGLRHGAGIEQSLLQPSLRHVLRRSATDAERRSWRRPAQSELESHLDGLTQPLYQLALEMADKAAAAFGMEPRYPFFDRRLMEFCLGLPEEQKFRDGWPRLLFRRAMEGILPPEVCWRSSKSNLSPNFQRRFREQSSGLLAGIDVPSLEPYLRGKRLTRMIAQYRAAPDSAVLKRESLALFRIVILSTWLRQRSARERRSRGTASMVSPAAA